jgi:hypothetical protein
MESPDHDEGEDFDRLFFNRKERERRNGFKDLSRSIS